MFFFFRLVASVMVMATMNTIMLTMQMKQVELDELMPVVLALDVVVVGQVDALKKPVAQLTLKAIMSANRVLEVMRELVLVGV